MSNKKLSNTEIITKKISSKQADEFNTEFVNDSRWTIIKAHINNHFPGGTFFFADLGCGNGVFADRILREYPKSTCILLDNSEYLLSKNKKNHRKKKIVCDSIFNAHLHIKDADIIFLNWVLHHLVSDTYNDSYNNIMSALDMTRMLAKERGFVSVFELMYDGLLFDNLPSHIIYTLSQSKILSLVFRKIKTSAAVAGIGVLFLSRTEWGKIIAKTNLTLDRYADDEQIKFPLYQKVVLHLGNVRYGHFWLSLNDKKNNT